MAMEPIDFTETACFETTKRLLTQLVNEGLLHAYLYHPKIGRGYALSLRGSYSVEVPTKPTSVTIHVKPEACLHAKANRILPILRPEYLEPPVFLELDNGDTIHETDPGKIFRSIYTWFAPDSLEVAVVETIAHELSTTALNQSKSNPSHCGLLLVARPDCSVTEKWLQLHANQRPLLLDSPAIAWEQCIIYGHPSHPDFLVPELSLVSVPRADLRVNGPFELLLTPLLQKLNVQTVAEDRVIVPCFTKQLPSIERCFPGAVRVASIVDGADAQTSMRSVVLRAHLGTSYILKMSLAYRITSAVRTIASSIIPEVVFMSGFLEEMLPPDLWIYREVAGVTGSGDDLDDARQISCIIREDLEPRAIANGQTLIVAAALYQRPANSDRTYAEIIFGLDTWDMKIAWFQRYIEGLCDAVLPPLANYGIALEAHAQNIVLRVSRDRAELRGFAVRDWGGVRLHKPTLQKLGIQLPMVDAESPVVTNDLDHIWSKFHQVFLQNHVASILIALGLESKGGWAIVRDELSRVLSGNDSDAGPSLLKYLLADDMQMRCFFTARLQGKPSVVSFHPHGHQ
ncbi:unnamed protein product [Penicillium egyptiacum]|uniref:Uncharacterized protein n=1 Tax=Penicillium egyptiacum TaxID=1303716 RepID=A0A9W4P2R2_9EURO|nr:unnamed protein product [Penicillium egyptiacum]